MAILGRSIIEMMYISSAPIRIRTQRFCQGGSAAPVSDMASLLLPLVDGVVASDAATNQFVA